MIDKDTVLKRVSETVQRKLANQGAGHGFDHVIRVARLARGIACEVGGDFFVIELAALLHDLGDAKFHAGVERSGEMAREILSELGVDATVIEQVAHIVDNLSFRKHSTAEPLSLEGQVVQDADRLDALGAIGIVRTIEYGAVTGQPFHVSGNAEVKSGLAHFREKLYRLHDLMNTEVARRIAAEREAFMRQFEKQFRLEADGLDV